MERKRITYFITWKKVFSMLLSAVFMIAGLTGCLRRPLWVYTDEYRQVELITDWSACGKDPGGMTAWFSKDDYSGQNRRITTAEVYHTWLNLPNGIYTGVVFDYSPDEYGNQSFFGMHRPDSCFVRCNPLRRQPQSGEHLYGDAAVPTSMDIKKMDDTGLRLVLADPDPMCADTLKKVDIVTGVDGDLIPWEMMDDYGGTLQTQTFYAYPHPITWQLRVFIHDIKGMNFFSSIKGTIAGLADGNQLSWLRHTQEPCLHPLESWDISGRNTSKNLGTAGCTIETFGFTGIDIPKALSDKENIDEKGYECETTAAGKLLQLNLQFVLRDEATVINYHYVTDFTGTDTPYHKDTRLYERLLRPEWISVYPDQRVIRIDIPTGDIELPYVDAKDSAGFDAEVDPWDDETPIHIEF